MSDWIQRLTVTPALIELARRAVPALAAGTTGLGLLIFLAWNAGGYFPAAQLTAGTVAFTVLAVLFVAGGPRRAPSASALAAIAALIGLGLWTGLSSRWSSSPDAALEDMHRVLLYVTLLGLGLVAVGSGRYSRHLVWAVLGVISVVCGAGLLSRLAPDLVDASATVSSFDDYRLGYPLTYWNAFGALGAMGVVLALGLAADTRSHPALRALAAGAVVPIGVAAYLTFSRGVWLAFGLGIAVLIIVGARRLQTLVTLVIGGGALAGAVVALASRPGLTDDPAAGAGQLAEGHGYLLVLAFLAAAAGGLQLLVALMRLRPEAQMAGRRLSRRLLPVMAVVVAIGAGVGYAVAGDRVEGESASRLLSAERWIDHQWNEFMTPAGFAGSGADRSGAERLTTARGTRSDLYRIAIDGFEARPLIGTGAGGFEVHFAYDRRVDEKVRDAHSLYLETLGELGVVGVGLLLAFLASVGWGATAARRRPRALGRQQAAAVIAALAVWAGHAAVDWDWQMPALTGTALLLAAAVLPEGRSSRPIRRRRSHAALYG